jgi:hypothetical protein
MAQGNLCQIASLLDRGQIATEQAFQSSSTHDDWRGLGVDNLQIVFCGFTHSSNWHKTGWYSLSLWQPFGDRFPTQSLPNDRGFVSRQVHNGGNSIGGKRAVVYDRVH